MRFVANKLGRLLTLGRIFSEQTFKLSPASSSFQNHVHEGTQTMHGLHNYLNVEDGCGSETRCALVERNVHLM